MSVGPFERLALRLSELEGRLGLRPGGRLWQQKVEGKARRLGPGGKWLLARLHPGHAERLDEQEEDALGEALALELQGEYVRAQEMLDVLAEVHKLRMEVERSNCDGSGGEK